MSMNTGLALESVPLKIQESLDSFAIGITAYLDMQVGHMLDLSNQWLSIEKEATFRKLISQFLDHSKESEHSLVWLLRPAIHQIYQQRWENGEFLTKKRQVVKVVDGSEVTEMMNTIDIDISSNPPQWAKFLSSIALFQHEAAVRKTLEWLVVS